MKKSIVIILSVVECSCYTTFAKGGKSLFKQLVQAANASGKTNLREPDLLMVITGGELAYTRPDGVKIIPIGCLRD